MDFYELAKLRESTRKYGENKIKREDIIKCIKAASVAPSACNSQPWKFIIVDDDSIVQKFSSFLRSKIVSINKFTSNCKSFVVVVEEPSKLVLGGKFKNLKFAKIDIGLATENFCLQAAELGIGTCIMGMFHERKVKNILKIPNDRKVRLVIAVGERADEKPREKVRKELDEIIGINKY